MTNQEIERNKRRHLLMYLVIYGTTVARNINNKSNDLNDMEVDKNKQQVQVDAIFL